MTLSEAGQSSVLMPPAHGHYSALSMLEHSVDCSWGSIEAPSTSSLGHASSLQVRACPGKQGRQLYKSTSESTAKKVFL